MQLALGNTNSDVTISLLNEFPQQLLSAEQNVPDITTILLSVYIRNYQRRRFMLQ